MGGQEACDHLSSRRRVQDHRVTFIDARQAFSALVALLLAIARSNLSGAALSHEEEDFVWVGVDPMSCFA